MNTREFVEKGISKVFEDLAEAVADEAAAKLGEDMPAGMIAFHVAKAQMYMLKKWAEYAEREGKHEQNIAREG